MHYRKLLEDTKATLVDVETQLANVQAFDKQAQALNGWLDEQLVQLGEQTDSAQTLSISSLETKLQTLEVRPRKIFVSLVKQPSGLCR